MIGIWEFSPASIWSSISVAGGVEGPTGIILVDSRTRVILVDSRTRIITDV